MRKIFKRLISYACMTALAFSGISISNLGDTTLIAHADSYNYTYFMYDPEQEIFNIGDTTAHEFSAYVESYDEDTDVTVTLDDEESNITYSWSLNDSQCFVIDGSSTGRTVKVKAKSDAATKLGTKNRILEELTCTAYVNGVPTSPEYLKLIFNSAFAQTISEASISPDLASFDDHHKSKTFTISGLDNVNAGKLQWEFSSPADEDFFLLTSNGKSATVTLRDDAASNWSDFGYEGNDYYAGYLCCTYTDDDPDQSISIPGSASLVYYPSGIFTSLEVDITSDDDYALELSEWEFNGEEQVTLYSCFSDPGTADELTNIKYSWSLDDDAKKFLEIVGPANAPSVVIKSKANPAIGAELQSTGNISLSVSASELSSSITAQLQAIYTVGHPYFELSDYTFNFNDEIKSHECVIENPDDFNMNMVSCEVVGDYSKQIFILNKVNATKTIITLSPNAADIIADNDLADVDEDGNRYFYTNIDYRLTSSTGNTNILIGSISLYYYLEGLYDVTYSPKELTFDNGVAAEKTLTANVVNPKSDVITYDWSLDETDPEAVKCFTLQGNGKSVKVRYNGTKSPDNWFSLILTISVKGKNKVLVKQPYIKLKHEDSQNPSNNENPNGSDDKNNSASEDNKQNNQGKTNNTTDTTSDAAKQDSSKQNTTTSDTTTKDATSVDTTTQNTTSKPAKTGTKLTDANAKTNGKFKVISSAEGNAKVAYLAPKNKKAKKVTIPSTIKDKSGVVYKVTKISANAFKKNKKITNVTVPKTVTSIDKNAFNGCSKLKVIKLNANTLKTIKAGAFSNINKNATFTITAKNKKTFNKLVKKLKKAGAKNLNFKYKNG